MLTFDEATHIYRWNNQIVPSVTQIPNRVAVRNGDDDEWHSVSGSEHMGRYENARLFGTEFHKIAAYRVQGIDCKYDLAFQPWVNGLNKFLDEHNLNEVIKNRHLASCYLVEKPLYSKIYGYAGTLDWFFILNTQLYCLLLDWKTSTKISDLSRMQTAALEQLIKENYQTGNRILPRWTVRIFENDYETDKREGRKHKMDFNRFLSLLNTYKTFSKE